MPSPGQKAMIPWRSPVFESGIWQREVIRGDASTAAPPLSVAVFWQVSPAQAERRTHRITPACVSSMPTALRLRGEPFGPRLVAFLSASPV